MSCETVDDIFKCLEELENQGSLRVTAENLIQTLKFQLRYVRMHIKWHTTIYHPLLCNIRTWVEDVEMRLLQPTRKGSIAADLSEETLSSLLLTLKVGKAILRKQCSLYYEDEQCGVNFTCKDVLIDELLLECIDPLLENLKHLIRCNDLNLLVFPKEQIEALAKMLRSLRNFLEITATEIEEVIKNVTSDLLTRIKRIIENAIYASCYSWAKGKQKRIEKLYFDLRVKINHIEPEIRMIYVRLLKASTPPNPSTLGIDLRALAAVDSLLDNLQKLLKNQFTGSFMPLDVHQIEFLHQELSFLKYFLMDPNLKQYAMFELQSFNSPLIQQVEVMAREGASLTHSICVCQTKDHMADEMNLLYSNLLKIVNLLKAEIRQMYLRIPKPTTSSFPRTSKFGFLYYFLQRLDELLKHRADSITYVKNEIEIVQSELGFLSSFVSDTIKKHEEHEHIAGRVVEIAYEAECVIDLISASNLPSWYSMLWLADVIEKIKMLRKDSTEVFCKKTCDINAFNVEKASIRDPPQAYTLAAIEEVVGFEDEAHSIIDRLINGPAQLDIVSIVGMGGIGKTTLAKKVFDHPSITRYFHARSWYCISQVYDRRDLLLSMLGDVTELSEKIREMNDKDMAEALCKSLKGRRYLIVFDDIWSTEPWDGIQNALPDDCNGSRILFTTRRTSIAQEANPRSSFPYQLRLLSEDECWVFLQNKVFKQRSCPLELYEIGRNIARNCRGLPLVMVLTAGLLRLEYSVYHWKLVLEDLRSCLNPLELSYKYLPDHLKPCFLYLGAFPEDKEIPTWKLIRLWIAEGFARKTKSESLENVAEGYLMDLIARGLILIAQNKSNGGVKSCRVHDILLDLSLKKAKDENFLAISHKMVNLEQSRQFFYCKHVLGRMPSDPYVRSLIFFPTEERPLSLLSHSFYNLRAFDLSVLPYMFKLLRVLDLEYIRLDSTKFPTEIELLVHLRYLAVQGRMNHVPSSVGKLWSLETFLLVGTGGKVKLPETLLEMAYLKHVNVSDEAAFELPDTFQPEKSFESDGIEKLSTLSLRHGDCTTEKVIRRLRSLRKLKCIFLESLDYNKGCNQFPVLDLLSKLESLNVIYHGSVRVQHPCEFSFPSNLKKLTLSNFCLPWSEISKIGRLLPQLEVLKLLSRAFEGRRWEVSDDEFCNLKFLKLESLDIVEWDASADAFPCLEQLVLQKCWRLEELPSSFEELSTLNMIVVQRCGYSAAKAVSKIQEKQDELRPDGFKVLIRP